MSVEEKKKYIECLELLKQNDRMYTTIPEQQLSTISCLESMNDYQTFLSTTEKTYIEDLKIKYGSGA